MTDDCFVALLGLGPLTLRIHPSYLLLVADRLRREESCFSESVQIFENTAVRLAFIVFFITNLFEISKCLIIYEDFLFKNRIII